MRMTKDGLNVSDRRKPVEGDEYSAVLTLEIFSFSTQHTTCNTNDA